MEGQLKAFMAFALMMQSEAQAESEAWKKRIQDEWEMSKNYPRKKKKKVRKELLLDWSIACWNPFEN